MARSISSLILGVGALILALSTTASATVLVRVPTLTSVKLLCFPSKSRNTLHVAGPAPSLANQATVTSLTLRCVRQGTAVLHRGTYVRGDAVHTDVMWCVVGRGVSHAACAIAITLTTRSNERKQKKPSGYCADDALAMCASPGRRHDCFLPSREPHCALRCCSGLPEGSRTCSTRGVHARAAQMHCCCC